MTRGARHSPVALCALLVLALAGCGTGREPLAWSPESLRAEVLRRAPQLGPADLLVPFERPAAPLRQARAWLRTRPDETTRTQALVAALSDPAAFDLEYQWAASRSARQALEQRGGNCFALSSVLVGLARGLGMRAAYLEVELALPDLRRDGGVLVRAHHIAAVVQEGRERLYVDFSGRLDRAHRMRAISDLEALAHYYNNRGYELLYAARQQSGPPPWPQAGRAFRLATRIAPELAPAWSNLGVARARQGDDEAAERAYRRALELAPENASTHLNLALLLTRRGAGEEAAQHLRRARALDPRNPQVQKLLDALVPERAGLGARLGG